jgi:hypothetical protein
MKQTRIKTFFKEIFCIIQPKPKILLTGSIHLVLSKY